MIDFSGSLPIKLGRVVATPGALAALDSADMTPLMFIIRHASGDWGAVDAEDAVLNDEAVEHGGRVLSSYVLDETDVTIWIITEADRSVTTILLPSEY
jgi:hypothetical protein